MDQSRRDAMRIASGLAIAFSAGLLKPSEVFAEVTEVAEVAWGSDWNGAVYSAKSLEAFVIAMSGDTTTPNTPRTVFECLFVKNFIVFLVVIYFDKEFIYCIKIYC